MERQELGGKRELMLKEETPKPSEPHKCWD